VEEWMESCYKHGDVAPEAGCDGRMVFKPVCNRRGVGAQGAAREGGAVRSGGLQGAATEEGRRR
jgi:hypothetical protein